MTTAILALVFIPLWLHPALSNADLNGVVDAEKRINLRQSQAQLQDETRATLLQGFGGLILVVGAMATWRQVHVSRHGQITERITRAVEQLAGARMDVRIGGLHALERVAINSVEDRPAITAILTAFVRTQAPWRAPKDVGHQHGPVDAEVDPPWAGTRAGDVQIALYILARRPRAGDEGPAFLSFADLSGARMGYRDWTGLICQYSNLARAWMPDARLDGAYLTGADLRHTHLVGARLVGAHLDGAHLQDANLHNADLRDADLTGACLDRADLTGAVANQRTKWPAGSRP